MLRHPARIVFLGVVELWQGVAGNTCTPHVGRHRPFVLLFVATSSVSRTDSKPDTLGCRGYNLVADVDACVSGGLQFLPGQEP